MMTIGVIDDDTTTRKMMGHILSQAGYSVETFANGRSFLEKIEKNPFDIVFLDLQLPDMGGLEILAHIKTIRMETEVIIVTGHGSIENAVKATKEGAFHYLSKPCRSHDLRLMAERAAEKIRLHRENTLLRSQVCKDSPLTGFIGNSKAMQAIFETIRKVSQVNCTILLEAETGTGKQLTARAIHELGSTKNAPFVYFNCGGFTEDLICSELFGHEKGAFTGASACKIGLFESAKGGTVLLDEIGEMPMSMQVKLLHVLQERQVLRVGGISPIDLDVRIIAATNKDLQQLIKAGMFREDLYYRLNVVTIRLPRLRERREDIPLLIYHFIAKANKAFSKDIKGISSQALDLLMHYSYPGNVRELENIIQHAAVLTEGQKLLPADLPFHLRKLNLQDSFTEELPPLDEVEKRYIFKVLSKTEHNLKAAGKILNIPRTTLWRKLKKYGLSDSADSDMT
ncbi:MAG: sigma-54 dependent transcriptional regulator [Proteobacteria bacterium]|nr:sigma-54 dependent transcriptional regulator [Pseudomonadota bacterium]MBU1138476.1 sigma-54 dependent transcriptional regulator [Pseudomonadota bacterium]MBU1233973.1 sigma-54 dependent transcriptional regulator [Pseudomonadota bacterium]MBU1419678.1 sigma-54 dependent transcriptional regulator [Pseudomonadota bacterium]MBU1454134.1 sigma-54 dependent transcriptional regulator [Pseudomonadota bacterium]